MAGSETIYAARFIGPEILEAGRDNVVTCSVYRDGGLATLTSGTITVWNSGNTKVVDAAVVAVPSNVATFTVTTSHLSGQSNSDGWRIEWALVIGGVTYTFRREASLVYRRLYPVVTDADLLRLHTDLTRKRPPTEASYQDYIDEAWAQVESRLIATGKRPWLNMAPSSLREVHLYTTAAMVFRDFATGGPESAEWAMMEKYEGLAEAAWGRLSYPEATPSSGALDAVVPGQPTTWLCGSAAWGR